MQPIHLEPDRRSEVRSPEAAREAMRVLGMMDAMGLLPLREPATYLQLSMIREAANVAARAGIGRGAAALLAGDRPTSRRVLLALRQLAQALEDSPLPPQEARELGRVLGWELLGALVGSSSVSLRRYAATVRDAPDDVAARLHFLVGIVGDLKGAYNDAGIRRWFERPRAQLDGRAPAGLLSGEWSPDQPGPTQVRNLARSLAGTGVA